MNRNDSHFIWGVLLVGIGFLVLMGNIGVIGFIWDVFWSLVFAGGGAFLLVKYLNDRSKWWPVAGAFVLFGISASIMIDALTPWASGSWGGAFFLAIIGAGFLAAYLSRPERWWAIIPSGVLFTLAATSLLGDNGRGTESGSVFFLGLGATFMWLYLLPGHRNHTGWALVPGIALLGLGTVVLTATAMTSGFVWATGLILAGIYLVYRNLHQTQTQ